MNTVQEILRLNALELSRGLLGPSSWHARYSSSSWVAIGNLPQNLTEGDVICVFSEFGEVEDVNLVRDKDTGKFKGFGFLKYEDQRSTILAVDGLCGQEILGRTVKVRRGCGRVGGDPALTRSFQ